MRRPDNDGAYKVSDHGQGLLGRSLSHCVLKHGFVEGVTDDGMEAFVIERCKARSVPGQSGDGVARGEEVWNQLMGHVTACTNHEHRSHGVMFRGAYLNACSSALDEQGFKACRFGSDSMDHLREEYDGELDPALVNPEAPLELLKAWIYDAEQAGLGDPTAMCLATLGPDGAPRSRMVLCKGVDGTAVRFFTNLTSDKAEQLHADARASLTFWWSDMDRSTRLTGRVTPLERDEIEAYFASRPRSSQIGAWVSDQSSPIEDRDALEAKHAEVHARFHDADVPCPPHWGGFRFHAHEVEYWAGRPARLHDRIRLTQRDGTWTKARLQP